MAGATVNRSVRGHRRGAERSRRRCRILKRERSQAGPGWTHRHFFAIDPQGKPNALAIVATFGGVSSKCGLVGEAALLAREEMHRSPLLLVLQVALQSVEHPTNIVDR